MSRTAECTIHELILDTRCSGILGGILSSAVTRPEIMVDQRWLYTTDFRAPRSMVDILLQYSMTKNVDYSVPLMPKEGTASDYTIPVNGSTLLGVWEADGRKEVAGVVHAAERHIPPISREKVRSMCLCIYCTTYHPYTVLDFSTTATYPEGVLVRYREYETKERPIHHSSFW